MSISSPPRRNGPNSKRFLHSLRPSLRPPPPHLDSGEAPHKGLGQPPRNGVDDSVRPVGGDDGAAAADAGEGGADEDGHNGDDGRRATRIEPHAGVVQGSKIDQEPRACAAFTTTAAALLERRGRMESSRSDCPY